MYRRSSSRRERTSAIASLVQAVLSRPTRARSCTSSHPFEKSQTHYSTVFVNWNIDGKTFFFNAEVINFAAYAEQLLPCGKAALCCILPYGIVWMHLNIIVDCECTPSCLNFFWKNYGLNYFKNGKLELLAMFYPHVRFIWFAYLELSPVKEVQ